MPPGMSGAAKSPAQPGKVIGGLGGMEVMNRKIFLALFLLCLVSPVMFSAPSEAAGAEQRAHYDLDNMIGIRFPVDFSSKGMVLGKGNAWSFSTALEGDSELMYAFQEEPFNLEDYEPTDLVTDEEKGFTVGMTKSSAYLWITDSEKYFDFEGGQGYVSIEIYGGTQEQIEHWYEALKNGAVEIFSLDGMDATERNADEAMSGLSETIGAENGTLSLECEETLNMETVYIVLHKTAAAEKYYAVSASGSIYNYDPDSDEYTYFDE
jgi:hypothetical protein